MSDDPEPARPDVWLVRHGETLWARDGRHTGTTDIELTDVGRAEAGAVAGKLARTSFAVVLSSPRVRALETARLAGFTDQVEIEPDLTEWDYGAYEGRTSVDIRRERPGWTIWTEGVVDGETAADVATRADRVIAQVRTGDGPALLFAHGHILRILAARWLGLPAWDGRLLALGTATVSVLGWERETPVILRWNEACGGDQTADRIASRSRRQVR